MKTFGMYTCKVYYSNNTLFKNIKIIKTNIYIEMFFKIFILKKIQYHRIATYISLETNLSEVYTLEISYIDII